MEYLDLLDGDELLALARVDFESDRFTEALVKLKFASNQSSIPVDGFALLARLYAQLGLHKKAINHYTQYLESKPEAVIERFELGLSKREIGDTDAAMLEWNAVLKRDAAFPPAMFYKSLLLLDRGDRQGASELLRHLTKNLPGDNLYVRNAHEILETLKKSGSASKDSASSEAASATPLKH